MMEYVGTRWYKCDFHLHTMSSSCYKNKDNTITDWVNEVEEKKLNCIAVTDHNDYRAISPVTEEASKRGIIVFPGVEVTCDSSKMHVLVLFDVSKTEDKVRDFLSSIDIDSDLIGKSDGTTVSIFDVCRKAKARGGMVIAAHIDEYNGINLMGAANQDKILCREYLDAVQVVNEDIWNSYKTKKDEPNMLHKLHERYGEAITLEQAHSWRKTYVRALKAALPILTFSDNPSGPREGNHGLWGIGARFTWIKMDKTPNLESLRQALLSDDMRIKNDRVSITIPEKSADYWIKYVRLKDSIINPTKELRVDFSPQLNTVIGGRGSGKSTIIRLLAGALDVVNRSGIDSIENEQNNFYRKNDPKTKLGIFSNKSEVDVGLYRNNKDYRLHLSNIRNCENQTIELYRIDSTGETIINDPNFLKFFRPLVYTQKQIFEIAKDQDALLKIIDSGIEELPAAIENREQIHESLLSVLFDIRLTEESLSKEGQIKTELEDINFQIEQFKKNDISQILDEKQLIANDRKIIDSFSNQLKNYIFKIEQGISAAKLPECSIGLCDKEINSIMTEYRNKALELVNAIDRNAMELSSIISMFDDSIEGSSWEKRRKENTSRYNTVCESLNSIGIDVNKLDLLLMKHQQKTEELDSIREKREALKKMYCDKELLEKKYKDSISVIRGLRKGFIDDVLRNEEDVRIVIKPFMNGNSFERMIKECTNKDGTINKKCFSCPV